MRSLKRRFKNIAQLNAHWSSYTCFAEAAKGQNFSKRIISKHFNVLVEKDDYDRRDRKQIVKYLFSLSAENKNTAEQSSF
jgi:hypothetical protein